MQANTMTLNLRQRCIFVCLIALVLPWVAHSQTLTAPAQRIGDRAIHADYRTYEQAQARIKALNDQGRPLRDYHLGKAQCWLDVSFHEYTRNDRSPFPQEALAQSLALVQGMEQKAASLPMDTPLVNNADRLRPDLWGLADSLKGHAGFQCVAQRVACAEVELVHAGNEHRQQGWRHAMPYLQIAEDQLVQAREQADACMPKPASVAIALAAPAPAAPLAVATPPLAPVPVPRPPQAIEIQANVLFNHNRSELDQARALTMERLAAALTRARESGTTLREVQLIGHADRTGTAARNEALAQSRVQTVREYLLSKGIAPALIKTSVQGDRQQVSACKEKFTSRAEELECLLPNRRVEVNFLALRQP